MQVDLFLTTDLRSTWQPRSYSWQMCKTITFSNGFTPFLQMVLHDAYISRGWSFFWQAGFFIDRCAKSLLFARISKVLLNSCSFEQFPQARSRILLNDMQNHCFFQWFCMPHAESGWFFFPDKPDFLLTDAQNHCFFQGFPRFYWIHVISGVGLFSDKLVFAYISNVLA